MTSDRELAHGHHRPADQSPLQQWLGDHRAKLKSRAGPAPASACTIAPSTCSSAMATVDPGARTRPVPTT